MRYSRYPIRFLSSLRSLSLVLTFALSNAAFAVDGVIELNNASALAGGVTPGDSAGYPITLSKSGSYRLTGDLYVSGANSDVVVISVDDVTLDLNGFSIKCLYFGTPCAGNGTGVGVRAESQTNITVRNGVIRDLGDAAILLGNGGHVESIRVIANGRGIVTTQGTVRDCYISGNIGTGVHGTESLLRDNFILENGIAIETTGGSPRAMTLQGNVITRNTFYASGSTTSLGGNKRCDSNGLTCVFF